MMTRSARSTIGLSTILPLSEITPEPLLSASRIAQISASTARQAIKDGDWELLAKLLPQTSFDYFTSDQAKPVISRIRGEENVSHY